MRVVLLGHEEGGRGSPSARHTRVPVASQELIPIRLINRTGCGWLPWSHPPCLRASEPLDSPVVMLLCLGAEVQAEHTHTHGKKLTPTQGHPNPLVSFTAGSTRRSDHIFLVAAK